MTDATQATAQVRSFNRTVTQRVGALNDAYLARDRPLGASRLLWEIGDTPTDLRALRARLDLDSGYLSRLVRGLERDRRFEGGFDVSKAISATPEELTEPRGLLLVARLRGEPIGCGALKLHGAEP